MSYIKQVLDEDEKIIHQAHVHWAVYITPVILLATSVIILVLSVPQDGPAMFIVGIVLLMIFLIVWLDAFLARISTELAVTDRRVISKVGFIRRTTSEINLSKVEGVSVDQGILGRILGFGTVGVTGTGGRIAPMNNIDDPLAFRAKVRPR